MKNLVGYQIEILRDAQNDKNSLLIADFFYMRSTPLNAVRD